mgnify:CR=1 FL=1
MWWRIIVEVIAAVIMLGGVGGILYGVLKGTLAFNGRTIQFVALVCVLPATLILSLERSLGNEGTAAIFATVVGYTLAVIGKNE